MERVDYESIVVQDLLNLRKNDELDLNPWYQRRSVWTKPQKAYLINSMFENKPIPTVYIRHYLDMDREKSIKEIVDGQQRLRAVFEFANNDFAARHPKHSKPIKYSALSGADLASFKMTKLSVGYLINSDDGDVIEIFGRLNSVSKTLNAQEKRNARFGGEMKLFCLKEAAKRVKIWRDLGVFSANDVSRMQEVQFVSDLIYNLINGLSDFSAARLDSMYHQYEESFPQRSSIESRVEAIFSAVAKLPPTALKDTIFSRAPLFFSLLLVLDEIKPTSKNLSNMLSMVDNMFNDGTPLTDRSKADAAFVQACTASTQRIKSRRVRHRYIRKAL